MSEPGAKTVVMPLRVRYYEADQQGVVFNMWYLAYFEDARNAYLEAIGHSLREMLASGHDIQVVSTQISWNGPVRWSDEGIDVVTHVSKIGRTSLTFEFRVQRGTDVLVTGQTVYVIVADDASGKRPVPDALRSAIEA